MVLIVITLQKDCEVFTVDAKQTLDNTENNDNQVRNQLASCHALIRFVANKYYKTKTITKKLIFRKKAIAVPDISSQQDT